MPASAGTRHITSTRHRALLVGGLIIYTENITEQVETARDLALQRSLSGQVLTNLPDTIVLVFNHRFEYVFAGGNALQLLGMEPGGKAGQSLYTIVSDEAEIKFYEDAYSRALDGERSLHQLPDDHGNFWNIDVFPLGSSNNKIDYGIVIAQDITNLKRTERVLEINLEEARKAGREIQDFASVVSHDMKTPILNIRGFTEELARAIELLIPVITAGQQHLSQTSRADIQLLLEEDIPEAFEFIDESLNRMTDMNRAVLEYARLGSQRYEEANVDMHELTTKTLKSLKHRIDAENIDVVMEPGLPSLRTDRLAMEQVMQNLLSNAIKYLVPGRTGRIRVSSIYKNHEVWILVKDNGRGIPDVYQERVFQIFRRGNNPDIEGTGVGLAYTRAILRQHDARIWFQSKEMSGTTFIIAFPIERVTA